MRIKKVITRIKNSLQLDKFKTTEKKESIVRLLKKLDSRKALLIKDLLDTNIKKHVNREEELKEELAIITLQIKKGYSILNELNT